MFLCLQWKWKWKCLVMHVVFLFFLLLRLLDAATRELLRSKRGGWRDADWVPRRSGNKHVMIDIIVWSLTPPILIHRGRIPSMELLIQNNGLHLMLRTHKGNAAHSTSALTAPSLPMCRVFLAYHWSSLFLSLCLSVRPTCTSSCSCLLLIHEDGHEVRRTTQKLKHFEDRIWACLHFMIRIGRACDEAAWHHFSWQWRLR